MRYLLPSLTALALTAAASAQTTWYVDPAGSNANPGNAPGHTMALQTINFANSLASAGDILVLAAATFGDEQGTVILGNKDLTIVGAGSGATTIQAHSTLTTNVNTGYPTGPVPTQQRPVVLIEGPGRVDFRDLCIDGAFAMPANDRLVGLYFRNGADGVVENCEIRNCRANPLSNAQVCAGVVVRGDDFADECQVSLRDCLVHEFGKGGLVSFFNATLAIEDCRFVGVGPTSTLAQNGIQISYDSGGSVQRTTITNLYYDGTSNSATGILAYDAGGLVELEDNNIGACQLGIHVSEIGVPAVTAEILRNRIHCADYAIELSGLSGTPVHNNSFHARDCLALKVAFDDGGNNWNGNSYSTYQGVGPYLITGPGNNLDVAPRATVDLLAGTPMQLALPPNHSPVDMVVANLDGVGGDDFATLDQNAGPSVSIGLNTGVLTNVPFGGATAMPVAIVPGYFDGASGIDLAVVTTNTTSASGQNKVYVLRNLGGIGSAYRLLSTTSLLSFTDATGIAAGNVDGDTDTDLVVTDAGTAGGSAVLLINDGSGTFTETTLPGSFTAPLRGAAIGRFNGDALADIALIEGDGTLGRLHLLAGDGTGGFVPFGSSPLTIGLDPTAIRHTDLDADLDNDLVIAFSPVTGGAVETLENDGAGSFTARRCLVDGGGATNLAVGDLDHDWNPDSAFGDVAVVNKNGGSVTLLGSYVAGAGYGAGGLVACNVTPTAAGFGNLNGDRYPDLYYCDAAAGMVIAVPATVTARTDYYGEGCPGTGARIPYLRPTGTPGAVQPNPSYGVAVDNVLPQALTVVLFCFAPAPYPTTCQSLVDLNSFVFAWLLVADAQGEAGVGVPLPATPALSGISLFSQAAALDPSGAAISGLNLALSRGMRIRLGR